MNQLPFTTGGKEDPLLPRLAASIAQSAEIDLAIAFIRDSGLKHLLSSLQDRLSLPQPAKLRILAGDYLGITDLAALRLLLELQRQGADVRVFETRDEVSFHPKVYIFADCAGKATSHCFVGSSNISHSALLEGIEWNLRLDEHDNPHAFGQIRQRFQSLFSHERSVVLSESFICSYAERQRINPPPDRWLGVNEAKPLTPNPIQSEALAAIATLCEQGIQRALVVLATGLGKTYLAAFAARDMQARRVLFVAHRREILTQAMATFARVLPRLSCGILDATRDESKSELLFASVQTLSRKARLEAFATDHFDLIIIDEFHHAAASSYRRILNYFKPRFMIGLTATPDRSDKVDILALCDGNLAFDADLAEGISKNLLCPFIYYGIADESVDYQSIRFAAGRFNEDDLAAQLMTEKRAAHALREWRAKGNSRTLAFCSRQSHADFMAEFFTRHGIVSVSVHSKSEIQRGEALARLEAGQIQVLFSVDLFNEGIDIPAIDTVLMLRPTESSIVFLQQLGRGLRKSVGKDRLVVIDFIGNHRSFLHKPKILLELGLQDGFSWQDRLKLLERNTSFSPGIDLNFDLGAIDLLSRFLQREKELQVDLLRSLVKLDENSSTIRPTVAEFIAAGGDRSKVAKQFGSWFAMLAAEGLLTKKEEVVAKEGQQFLIELETTSMSKSYKMICLEAFLELDGFNKAPTLSDLAERSRSILLRRHQLLADTKIARFEEKHLALITAKDWLRYWRENPIKAWLGSTLNGSQEAVFVVEGEFFKFNSHQINDSECLSNLINELIEWRLADYEQRLNRRFAPSREPASEEKNELTPLIFAPAASRRFVDCVPLLDIATAAGPFLAGTGRGLPPEKLDTEDTPWIAFSGKLTPHHFAIRVRGDSMSPKIPDGSIALCQAGPALAGSREGKIVLVELDDSPADSGRFTLKKYHSVKNVSTDDWQHKRIELQSLNKAYPTIVLEDGQAGDLRVIGVFEKILN